MTADPAAGSGSAPSTTRPATRAPSSPAAPSSTPTTPIEVSAKSTVGANDSLLLAGLVMVFALAVSGVVIVAGRRAGRRLG